MASDPAKRKTSTTDGGVNTNADSIFQKFLGTHTPVSKRDLQTKTKEEIKAMRRRKARMKMVDMSPAQKKAELTRLRKKRAATIKRNRKTQKESGSF